MTVHARVVATDSLDVDAGAVRLSPGTLDSLDAKEGDAVELRGDRGTVAAVGPPADDLDDGTVVAGDDVLTSAAADVGDVLAVSKTDAVPATAVRVAPTSSLQFEGAESALRRVLVGRHLVSGDKVRATMLGGGLTVTFVVTAVSPDGPVTVEEGTTIDLVEEPQRGVDDETAVARDDVGGLDEEWRTLTNLVGVPLTDSDVYRSVGGRPPNGVLLHGPPGTGKTMLVRALAGETGVTLRRVTRADLDDRAEAMALAEEARRDAPTILFSEDVDRIAPEPDAGSARGQHHLGDLFDAIRSDDDVILVGETARLDAVDPGVRRGGRFDRELRVEVPGPDERAEILEIHAADLRVDDDVDLASIARRAHGFVGADLAALVTEATSRAVGRLPIDASAEEVAPQEFLDGLAVTAEDLEAAMETIGPSALRGVVVERPDVGYRDIGGLDWAKREVVRAVEWPLRFPEVFDRLSTSAPTGVLLYGPPGTGKTMLARAVASSTDANFVAVDGPELMDKYVGESERGVREVFERARETAPTVVFFDEVDALAPERGEDSGTGAVERVVSQLLTELDGLEPRGDVVVMAATNRPDMVDQALLRPGRLEKTVEVPLPNEDARRDIFGIHLTDVPTAELDLDQLAAGTEGFTGSDVAAAVREASLLAMEEYLKTHEYSPTSETLSELAVEQSHLVKALNVVGPSVSEEQQRRYARIAAQFSGRGPPSSGGD